MLALQAVWCFKAVDSRQPLARRWAVGFFVAAALMGMVGLHLPGMVLIFMALWIVVSASRAKEKWAREQNNRG